MKALFIINSAGERRKKSISRSSVRYAFQIAKSGTVTGPKQLKIYGASYVYAIFVSTTFRLAFWIPGLLTPLAYLQRFYLTHYVIFLTSD